MWDLAVREGDWARKDSLLRRGLGARPLDLSDRLMTAMARGDSAAVARLLVEARTTDVANVLQAVEFASVYMHDLDVAKQLARIAVSRPRVATALRERTYDLLAQLELAGGRWSGAREAFESAEREGVDVKVRRAHAATLPFMPVPRAELQSVRAGVGTWDIAALVTESTGSSEL